MSTNPVLVRLARALSETPGALRGILANWEKFDDEQREHYAGEVEWVLSAVREQIDELAGSVLELELARSIESAVKDFRSFGDEIKQAMGFRPEEILPFGLATAATKPTSPACVVITQTAVTVLTSKTIQRVDGTGRTVHTRSQETTTTRTTTQMVAVNKTQFKTRLDDCETASNILAVAA